MKKVELKNAKEKFANARELCPGMSEEMYIVTDYLATVVKDTLVPENLVMTVLDILDSIDKGKTSYKAKVFPELFIKDVRTTTIRMLALPKYIDEVADEEFATKYRKVSKDVFRVVPPKTIKTELGEEYPEYAKVAANYWANAIQAPKLKNGDSFTSFIATAAAGPVKKYTDEEIKTFQDNLTESIYELTETYGECLLSVDYGPCSILANAGSLIGVNPMFGYPWKTRMYITKKSVEVKEGYGANRKVIYSKLDDLKNGIKKVLNLKPKQ